MKNTILLLAAAILITSCTFVNTTEYTCAEVTAKERIQNAKESYYLVFTSQGEFTIVDEPLRGNWNSSSWYGAMKVGQKYTFDAGGIRMGFASSYQNIYTEPTQCN